jgi:hypothetical protein
MVLLLYTERQQVFLYPERERRVSPRAKRVFLRTAVRP